MQFNEDKGEDDFMAAVSRVQMVVEESYQLGSDCELSDGSGRTPRMNRESHHHHHPGATKDSRGCEDCEEEGKVAPGGSLRIRKCHACDRKKDLAEKRHASNLQEREDIELMDSQSASGAAEEILPVINNMTCSNNVGDGGVRVICTGSFSMVHEHSDVCAGETVSSSPSEEAERMFRRREILRTVKKESRTLLAAAAIDPSATAVERKEKGCSGYSNAYTRVKMLHEKEIAALNERRDQELEEQELEKRERGWVSIGNGPVPKMMPTKNTSAVEVINPVVREPKERAFSKLRSLREKPDAQRVLGLVARRTESRVTSPTHRRIDTTERDDQRANLDLVISSSGFQSKLETKAETTPPGQTGNSTTTDTTLLRRDDMVSATNGEGAPKPLQTSSERADSNPKISSEMPSCQNSRSNRSSPRTSTCRVNDNPLYGTNSDVDPAACGCIGVLANPTQLYSTQSSTLQPVAHSRVAVLTKPPETESSSRMESSQTEKNNKKSSSFSSPKTTSPSYVTPVPSPSFQSASPSPACRSPEPTKQQTIAKVTFPLEHVNVKSAVEIVADEERSSSSICGRSTKEKVRAVQLRGGGGGEQKNCTGYVGPRKFASSRPCPDATLCKKVLENQQALGSKLQPEVVSSPGGRSWKSTMLWPAHKTYQALAFQLKVAAKLLSLLTWMLKTVLYGFGKALLMPVVFLSTVANMVISWITWPFGCIGSARYSGYECLAKTYILLVLSSLFMPSLFDFDFFLVHKFVEGEVVIREGLHFDYTKTHPAAVVHVLPQHIIYKSKGFSFNLPDKEVMAARAFPASHKFQVTVHLTVPESEYNHQIGMFQVVAETFSVRGNSLEKASRPSMLRYHSPPVRIAKSLLMGMPVLLGLCQESQTISVRVMDSHEEQELNPTATIRVVLEPKAGNVIGTGVPEIYKAELQVVSHLPWMRDVARSWVWSLYLYSGLGLLLFDALLVMCCCRRLNPQKPETMSNVHSEGKVLKGIPERGVTKLPGIPNNGQSLSQRGFGLAAPSSSNALNDIQVDDMQIGKQLQLIKA